MTRSRIKAAFAAAWGPPGTPHGNGGRFSNRPVFFPAGDYIGNRHHLRESRDRRLDHRRKAARRLDLSMLVR